MKQLVFKKSNFNIVVDPVVECFGVLFILSDFSLNKTRSNEKYVERAKECFSKFCNNKLVEIFKKLLKNGAFKYDAPIEMALCISQGIEPSVELLQRANLDSKGFVELKNHLLEFMKQTEFEKYFQENIDSYVANIEKFYSKISAFQPQVFLFDFLGLKSDKLNVLLMFLATTSNYGIKIGDRLYCCIRPYKESAYNNDIDFAFDMPYVTSLILHEFAHSFINPLTSKYIKAYKNINMAKFKEIFNKQPYGEHVQTAINELIIRAIECIYIKRFFPKEYQKFKQEYIDDGFGKINLIEPTLQRYFQEKTEEQTITDIYPKLLDILIL